VLNDISPHPAFENQQYNQEQTLTKKIFFNFLYKKIQIRRYPVKIFPELCINNEINPRS
jgi:hypothetical protein